MASPATAPPLVSAEDLLLMPDGDAFELADGVLVERCVGEKSGWIESIVGYLLQAYVLPRKLGYVLSPTVGLRIFPGRPNRVPRPDATYISLARHGGELTQGYLTVAPELVVEVVSPHDDAMALETKVTEYLGAGVLLVWVVYPETRTIHVYTPGREATRLSGDDVLTGGDVLPGFEAKLSEIFLTLE